MMLGVWWYNRTFWPPTTVLHVSNSSNSRNISASEVAIEALAVHYRRSGLLWISPPRESHTPTTRETDNGHACKYHRNIMASCIYIFAVSTLESKTHLKLQLILGLCHCYFGFCYCCRFVVVFLCRYASLWMSREFPKMCRLMPAIAYIFITSFPGMQTNRSSLHERRVTCKKKWFHKPKLQPAK